VNGRDPFPLGSYERRDMDARQFLGEAREQLAILSAHLLANWT
jgi:hypothetical protein